MQDFGFDVENCDMCISVSKLGYVAAWLELNCPQPVFLEQSVTLRPAE